MIIEAQNTPSLQADRPDQTECPYIVPTTFVQIETGFVFENENKSNANSSVPSVLWKYGLNKYFELRLITEYITSIELNNRIFSFQPITIGFKCKLSEERGIIPKTSFIGHIKENTPSFRFTMQHNISDRFTISYNLGSEWENEISQPTYVYTLTLGTSITQKLGSYFELYGFENSVFPKNHNVDFGITYLINNDFMIDISRSIGLFETSNPNYLNIGFSYRFKIF